MYGKQTCGYVILDEEIILQKDFLDRYDPPRSISRKWKHWLAHLDFKTCPECRDQHGEIYSMEEEPTLLPPLHPNCRCKIQPMEAVESGYGTKDGQNGADWWIKYCGVLPEYYITEEELKNLGWKWGKSPAKFAPGKMVTMGIFYNKNNHLPQIPGRIWYEADINYYSGRRNRHRLLWSNDGLLFVTYDHYETFIEVV